MKRIVDILIERDGMTKEDALSLIKEAQEELQEKLENSELPFEICAIWFGLEEDYIFDLLSY